MLYEPKPIVSAKLHQLIAQQIMDSIEKGELKPGDKLPPEREWAMGLQVSRTSLREALRALEIVGLIESKVGDGAYVSDISPDNIFSRVSELISLQEEATALEIIEASEILDVAIAKLASERIGSGEIANLEAILDRMESGIRGSRDVLELDMEFHNAMAKATQNRLLIHMREHLSEIKKKRIWKHIRAKMLTKPEEYNYYLREHQEILKAVKEKDSQKAVQETEKHLKKFERYIVEGCKDLLQKEP